MSLNHGFYDGGYKKSAEKTALFYLCLVRPTGRTAGGESPPFQPDVG